MSKITIKKYFKKGCPPCNRVQIHLNKLGLEVDQFDLTNYEKEKEAIKIRNKEIMEIIGANKLEIIPTVIFYKDGEQIKKLEGEITEKQITDIINK